VEHVGHLQVHRFLALDCAFKAMEQPRLICHHKCLLTAILPTVVAAEGLWELHGSILKQVELLQRLHYLLQERRVHVALAQVQRDTMPLRTLAQQLLPLCNNLSTILERSKWEWTSIQTFTHTRVVFIQEHLAV